MGGYSSHPSMSADISVDEVDAYDEYAPDCSLGEEAVVETSVYFIPGDDIDGATDEPCLDSATREPSFMTGHSLSGPADPCANSNLSVQDDTLADSQPAVSNVSNVGLSAVVVEPLSPAVEETTVDQLPAPSPKMQTQNSASSEKLLPGR